MNKDIEPAAPPPSVWILALGLLLLLSWVTVKLLETI